jgi:hypothetical protein
MNTCLTKNYSEIPPLYQKKPSNYCRKINKEQCIGKNRRQTTNP